MKKVYYISGPSRNVMPGYWLYDFLSSDGYQIISFWGRNNDTEPHKRIRTKIRIAKAILYILFHAEYDDLILVYDFDTAGLYLGLVISLFRPKLTVHKINSMAGDDKKLYSPLKRKFVSRAYGNIITTVNNEDIQKLYTSSLNVPASHFIPVPDSICDFHETLSRIKDRTSQGYIFMGGATNRDYKLFIDCATRLPQYTFKVVAFSNVKSLFNSVPSNLRVEYDLPEMDFYERIAHCALTFIPLTSGLQGGQMVLFEAACLEKAIMTTDSLAIHTYFDNKAIEIVPIGDVDAAIRSINKLMVSEELRREMGTEACRQISVFNPKMIYKQYCAKLFPASITNLQECPGCD